MGAAAAAADGETEGGEEPDPPLEEGAARAGAARREKEAEIGTETTETEFRPFTSPAGEEGLSAGSGSTLVVDSGIVDKEVVYIASSSAGAVEGEGTVAGKNLSSTGCEEGGASASALVLALASASTTTTTVVVAAASASAYVDPPFYAVAISEDDAGERVGVGELDTPQEKEAITVTCPGEEKTGAAMTDVGPHLPLPSTAAAAAEREAQEKRPAEGLGLDFASPSASASATIDGEVDVVPLPPTGDGSKKLAVSILGGERAGDGNGSASADSRERKKCRDNGIDPAATKFDPDPDGAINPPRAPPEAMFRDISSAAAILSLLDDPGGAAAFSNGDAGVVDEGGRMAEPAIALRDGDGDGDGDNNDNDNNEDDDNDEAAAEPGRTAYRTSLAATMVRGDVFAAAPAIREATGFLVNSPASALAWKAAAAVFAAVTLEEDTAAVAAATVVAVEAEVPPEAPPPLSSSSATGTFLGDGGVEGGGGEKRAETSAVDPEAAVAAVSDNKPPSALTSVEEVFSAAAVSAPLEEGEERTTTSSVTLANGLASVEGADASSATLMARIAAVAAATAEAEGAPDKKERRGVETMLSSVEPARTVTPPVAAGVENDGAAVVDADVIDRRRLNRPSLKRKRRLRLRDGAAPASGSAFTCLAISPPPPSECGGGTSGAGFRYVALGDASGFVTLYVTSPFLSPVSRLETTASYRSHIEESAALSAMRDRHPSMPPEVAHARVRAGWRPEGGGGGDAVLASAVPAAAPTEALMYRSAERNHASAAASHPNAIEAVCFAGVATTGGGLAVVVSTKVEVEMIDCRFGAVLWRCDTYRIPAWSSTVSVDDDNNNGAGSGTGGRGAQRQRTRMSRGPAMRLESSPLGGGFVGNGGLVDGPGDGGILASFIFGTRRNPDDDKRRKKKTVEAPPLSAVAGEDNADPSLVSPLLLFRPAGARKEWKAGDDLTRGVEVMGIIPVERWTPKDHGNVEIDCPPRPLVLGPRTMAIWDRSDRSRILASVFNLSPSPLVRAADAVATSFSGSSSSSGNHVQELLLMDSSTGLILQRAPLPTRVSGSKTITSEAVGQTPDGTYVAAATSARGGIRLYETETLTILAVYGEGVALHGHTICWQDVSFVRWSRPDVQRDEAGHEVRRGRYVEREDELRHRLSRKDDVATGGRQHNIKNGAARDRLEDMLLVGVPHSFREPLDLNESIHFWDMADAATRVIPGDMVVIGGTRLPSFTVSAPPKSGGVHTLLHDSTFDGDESGFIITTQRGDCRQLRPTMASDWPGRMYPPGYQVVDDNVEYIEDEDALDVVVAPSVPGEGTGNDGEVLRGYGGVGGSVHCLLSDDGEAEEGEGERDPADRAFELELREALRRTAEDVMVDVGGGPNDGGITRGTDDSFFIPCRPEPYLRERTVTDLNDDGPPRPERAVNGSAGGGGSPGGSGAEMKRDDDNDSLLSLLSGFPQAEEVLERSYRDSALRDKIEAAEGDELNSIVFLKSRSRKVKSGSLEAILNASINPSVKKAMVLRERWCDGAGSSVRPPLTLTPMPTPGGKGRVGGCPACLGRLSRHLCGYRAVPEDLDAIHRAEREKKELEDAERRQNRLAKKRATDAKRREVKRKQRQEEEKRKVIEEEQRRKKDKTVALAEKTNPLAESLGEVSLSKKHRGDPSGGVYVKKRKIMTAENKDCEKKSKKRKKKTEEEKDCERKEFWRKFQEVQAERRRREEEEQHSLALNLQSLKQAGRTISHAQVGAELAKAKTTPAVAAEAAVVATPPKPFTPSAQRWEPEAKTSLPQASSTSLFLFAPAPSPFVAQGHPGVAMTLGRAAGPTGGPSAPSLGDLAFSPVPPPVKTNPTNRQMMAGYDTSQGQTIDQAHYHNPAGPAMCFPSGRSPPRQPSPTRPVNVVPYPPVAGQWISGGAPGQAVDTEGVGPEFLKGVGIVSGAAPVGATSFHHQPPYSSGPVLGSSPLLSAAPHSMRMNTGAQGASATDVPPPGYSTSPGAVVYSPCTIGTVPSVIAAPQHTPHVTRFPISTGTNQVQAVAVTRPTTVIAPPPGVAATLPKDNIIFGASPRASLGTSCSTSNTAATKESIS